MKKLITFILSSLIIYSHYLYAESNEDRVIQIGEKYSKELVQSLSKELQSAIKDGGITSALSVCSKKAILITSNITKENPDITIKRTTFKYRNPLNAPDNNDSEALNFLQKSNSTNFYIKKVTENNQIYYLYYKKLHTKGLCLKCHGTESEITNETSLAIKKLYPNDKAVGYKSGELRGSIKVSIPLKYIE